MYNKVTIDTGNCIGCGDCQDVCPTDSIQLAFVNGHVKGAIVFDSCICCSACASACICDCIDDYECGCGSGGGSGSGGGIIIPGGGGSTSNYIKYIPSDYDILSRPNLKKTMHKQIQNCCVTSIMEYINHELCNGNINEGVYILDYYNRYNILVSKSGVMLDHIKPFLSHHFNISTFSSFNQAIDNKQVIMTDIESDINNSSHNVLVIGYRVNGQLIYMDPQKGYLMEAHPSKFNQNYAFPISGCK